VLADLDPQIADTEQDPEIQDLLRASEGVNLGVDYLPGAAGFDPLGWTAPDDFAAQLLWFDAFVQNVDRTWRNPNLLVWHQNIWLIDHGAALYFHHNWKSADPAKPFDARDHVLKNGEAGLAQGERFRWLTAPRSTIVQPGPVHTGLTADPAAELDRLFAGLVLTTRHPAPGPA
jgi:hypothetical protein